MSSHYEVAHAWAHQTGRNRRGHNMFYDGATIYSYGTHFPIARLVEIENAEPVVLFTTRGYSISTSAHKSAVRSACSHKRVFDVDDVTERADHATNYDGMIQAAGKLVATASRARTRGGEYLSQARDVLASANRYAQTFGLEREPVTLESLGVAVADLEARLAAARAEAERREQQARIDRAKREKALRRLWLSGEKTHWWHGTDAHGGALLRVDGDDVETSLGARVPLAHAVRAFRFIKLVRERGEPWQRNGSRVPVGPFQLDAIDSNGNLRAGCHQIRWAEIARFARKLGIFEQPASNEALASLAC